MLPRNTLLASSLLSLSLAPAAAASFVSFVVTSTAASTGGQNLVVYTLWARFDGPTDTVLNAFNLGGVGGSSLTGFWHKDNAYYNSGVLSQEFGTWNPSQTGSITLNRPFDSFLVIGGQATTTNTTNADPQWVYGGTGAGAGDSRSWNRADLPNNGTIGWFNSNPPNNQGRVGSPGNTATDVRLGQFVLSPGHCGRTLTLTIGYNNGVAGSAVQFATQSFALGETTSPLTWYRDVDGDGIGFASDGTLSDCSQPPGYSSQDGDNCPSIANSNQSDSNANGTGDVCEFARGDLNLDGIVNASDVPLFFNAWGGGAGSSADMNFDGVVNSADFSILLGNWGTTA
jgi:hypothetical protein